MNTISCHRKYPITTNFLDTMLEHSVEIQEGETKLDAYRRGLKELDQIAAELRREANPGIQQNGNEETKPYIPEPDRIGIIDLKNVREQEEMEDRIIACESIDDLLSIKAKYIIFPVPILKIYNAKLKELSDEK